MSEIKDRDDILKLALDASEKLIKVQKNNLEILQATNKDSIKITNSDYRQKMLKLIQRKNKSKDVYELLKLNNKITCDLINKQINIMIDLLEINQ